MSTTVSASVAADILGVDVPEVLALVEAGHLTAYPDEDGEPSFYPFVLKEKRSRIRKMLAGSGPSGVVTKGHSSSWATLPEDDEEADEDDQDQDDEEEVSPALRAELRRLRMQVERFLGLRKGLS
jgi:hypothetical protein